MFEEVDTIAMLELETFVMPRVNNQVATSTTTPEHGFRAMVVAGVLFSHSFKRQCANQLTWRL